MNLPAVHTVRENLGKSSASGDDTNLLQEDKFLKAYAEIVVGIQFYRNDDYDAAIGYLCGGAMQLQQAMDHHPQSHDPQELLFKTDQQKLIAGVRALAKGAIVKSRNQQASKVSAVSGGETDISCPGGEN
jgi:hypothetical protein